LTRPEDLKIADAVKTTNQLTSAGRVTEGNFIDAAPGAVAEIAQVNPMVALAVDAYSPKNGPRSGSFRQGKMSFHGVPTLKTFQAATGPEPAPGAAIDFGMTPIANPGNYAELAWTSRLLASGDLEVTYTSQEVNSDDIGVRPLYPSIRIVLSRTTPSKLINWHVAN
jgi:hypothetical protein